MNSNLPTNRVHRTALVVDVRQGVSAEFQNRYRRLLESVNNSNIKVDVFTLRGNSTQTGPGLVSGSPDQTEAPVVDPEEIDLRAWAKNLGYTQLLISMSV